MKYKLINKTTGEEHLCDKVTIDGFDYYVSDETIEEGWKGTAYKKDVKGEIFKHFYTTNQWYNDAKKVIATNNPNIDIPKVVDKVSILANEYEKTFMDSNWLWQWNSEGNADVDFTAGYNKSQETHSFSEEDMIEFAEWCQKPCLEDLRQPNAVYISSGNFYWYKHKKYTPKELLQLWKEQQPKIVYYD